MDNGSAANKRRGSSFITYLGQWFRGQQTPEYIPAPPPNNPRHLPPPSQFVSLSSATVHPRLAIPFADRINNSFFRLATALPRLPSTLQTSHPLSVSAFLTQLTNYRPCSDPFQRGRTTRPRPYSDVTGFHGAPLSRSPSLSPRRTCRFAITLLHLCVVPKSRLAPVSADPAQTMTRRPHVSDHTRPSKATVLGLRLSYRGSLPGDVPYRLEDSNHSLHLVELASSTTFTIYPRHRRPSGDRRRPPPHGLASSPSNKRWSPYRPLFTATLARTIPPLTGQQRLLPAIFSVYPPPYPRRRRLYRLAQRQQPHVLSLPTQPLATPRLIESKLTTALPPSSTTQQRATFPITVNQPSRVNASVYTAFLISTLVRHHGVLFPSG